MVKRSAPATAEPQPPTKREETRERIIVAAIDVFGLHGYTGASTRMLAEAAGVNLQALQYYFGGKDGLYLAAADHIGARVGSHFAPAGERVRARLNALQQQGDALGVDEARHLLADLLGAAITVAASEDSAPWARFLSREQMDPSDAFERLYARVMGPMIDTARRLVGVLVGEPHDSEHVRLRTIATVSQVMVFRFAHAAVMRQLGWRTIGPTELAAIRSLLDETVATLGPRTAHHRSGGADR